MKKIIVLSTVVLVFSALSLFFGCGESSTEISLDDSYYTDLYGWNESGGRDQTFLGRGINLGNYFEAPKSDEYPLSEGAWSSGFKATEEDFARMKEAGFQTVRIPMRWSDHAEEASPYTLDSAYLARIKEVVGWAIAADLRVVMNIHHYNEMFDCTDASVEETKHFDRVVAIWDQLCDEFPLSTYSADYLVFELLNEPHGSTCYNDWNNLLDRLVTLIWTTHSSTQKSGDTYRKIMLGTANWGGLPGLANLVVPAACDSENTLITVHYYEPFQFTHQGAEWSSGADQWIGTLWRGTAAECAPLIALFEGVVEWNSEANRGFEIFMGEFGVYSKYADEKCQQAWTAFISREAEKRNFSWAYWEYSSGFGAYDPWEKEWKPQLIGGLIPADK